MKVKKIWSLNPSRYKTMSIEKAIEKYAVYIVAHTRWALGASQPLESYKTFNEWLETEI